DWLMLAAQNYGYTASSAPLFNSDDPTIARMYAFPPMARAYWRAVQDAVNGPLDPANYVPVMDAKYDSLVDNSVAWSDGNALTAPTAVKTWFSQRRAALQTQLTTVSATFSINGTVPVSNGVGVITGTAPVGAKILRINGADWPVTWTTVSNWSATVSLAAGSNVFSVVGIDSRGQVVAGASNAVSTVYGGTIPSPVNAIVINEIMMTPAALNAEYVELFNASSNFTFDLSGWSLNGLSYDFPNGSFLAPQRYLVLARDRVAFNNTYGAGRTVFDSFSGTLQSDGETLSLLAPGPTLAAPIVVDRVRYETNAPWPNPAAGSALQLVDVTQDNSRVADWKISSTPGAPQWVYFSTNGTATSSRLYIYLQSAGDIYLDDIRIVAGGTPDVGANFVTNGGFETALTGPWNLTGNFSQSAVTSAEKYSGSSSLHLVATAAGSGSGNAIYQDVSPALVIGQTYSLSFWYRPGLSGGPLTLRLSGSNPLGATVDPITSFAAAAFTPGASNSVSAKLPAFPTLWLNELQAENLTGPMDNFSQRDPWVEIYNPGSNALSLAGFYLSDGYSNLTKWAFPANAAVPALGFLQVWCDNQTNQGTASIFHSNFRLAPGAGSVIFSRTLSNSVQVVDYLNYAALPANWSYGDVPDGQPFYRRSMFFATPNSTNSSALPPISVFINEWMADNTYTLADPADGQFEDWFEIFNPGTNAVDLGGYYLTDTLTNKTKFLIPSNGHYLVPANGFLLVWADDEAAQNSLSLSDLHAGFALGKSGEAIGLFSVDGLQIDAITFGAQTSDVSQGHFPDGTGPIYQMNTASPRSPNFLDNTPPVLAPITNRSLTLGQTLSLMASAMDADLPAQSLTYSLGAGAPFGATIHPSTGVFAWTPIAAPATNSISVVVTDSGLPSLSATQTFSVIVYLPPAIGVQF
ncbi:MAG: lamin tail domain-containing protein, partial [Verrucomicrobiota bacterium]